MTQRTELDLLGDIYRPPQATDTSLTIVNRTWFEAEPILDETQLAAVCWFEYLNRKEGR